MTKLYTMLSSVSGAIGALALALALCLAPQEAKAAVAAPGCTNNCSVTAGGNPNAVPHTCKCGGTCDKVNAGDRCSDCTPGVAVNTTTGLKACVCACTSIVFIAID